MRPALLALLLAACANHDQPTTPAPSAPITVTTSADAAAALGKTVRVTGTAYREKLGDAVESGDLRVICMDPRFPADRLNGQVTVEGVLSQSSFEAETGPDGEISQGTAPGVKLLTISSCSLK